MCRRHNVAFTVGYTAGLFGYVFVDFGNEFVVTDTNGEMPKSSYIESITKDKDSIITVTDQSRHDLEDGDVIRLSEVGGMEELNGKEFTVTVKSPYQISIGDTSSFGDYTKGGYIEEVKLSKTFSFSSMSSFFPNVLDTEKVLVADYSKLDRIKQYHAFIQGLSKFKEVTRRNPRPWNKEDGELLVSFARETESDIDEKLLLRLTYTSLGSLSPMCTYLGGIVAQEVIKATSSKYVPINQWFYFDSLECLPEEDIDEELTKPINSIYDSQISVFGKPFCDRLMNAKYFLVGAGAIGCEILKTWAMLGLGCGTDGQINITDMDTIEISNLNRQFLYRPWQVGRLKSEVAAEVVKEMNNAMNIKSWSTKVGKDTETTFNSDFWCGLDGVCNALDNVDARLYVDSQCVFYRKSLLESGTMGTKGNTQVIVPSITESYGSSRDPPPKETPICLLHSFPNNIEHCLQWAREQLFEGHFVKNPETVNSYLDNENFIKSLPQSLILTNLEILEGSLVETPQTFEDCIKWSRLEFEKRFNHQPKQLLYNFPLDHVDNNGVSFWSGSKRPPTPIVFDISNELHLNFIVSATFLRAFTLGICDSEFKPLAISEKVELIKSFVKDIEVPDFVPQTGLKIKTEPNSTVAMEIEDESEIVDRIKSKLPDRSMINWRMNSLSFEKDNEKNFHIDFIAAAANLRASVYSIPTVDRLRAKQIAGKIIPAIVTTTACVSGLVCLELYKLFQGFKQIEPYRNTYINLAIPVFQQSEPIPPIKSEFQGKQFTLWDRIDVNLGDCTLNDLFQFLKKEYNIGIDVLSAGKSLIYADWIASTKSRLERKVKELVHEITNGEFKDKKFINLNISATNEDGDSLDYVPDVIFHC